MSSQDPSADTAFERVRDAQFVLLTTFKRDGSAVPTPVWAVPVTTPEGHGIRVWTQRKTGKVKRIRNSGRVQVAPCTRSGKPEGETVDATARLLDAVGTKETLDGLRDKYGLLAKIMTFRAKRHLDASIGIEVVPKR